MVKSIIIIFSCLFLNYAYANKNIIKERKKNFQVAKNSIKEINQALMKKSYYKVNHNILFLYNWFKVLPSYFPKGSEASILNESDASSEIWENFNLFKKYSNDSKNISLSILESLNKKDRKSIDNMFDELSRSCSTCHRRFRN